MSPKRVIGVDIGGTKILGGVVTRDGTIESTVEVPTPVTSEQDLVAGLESVVRELVDDAVDGLGFGVPSQIDQRDGLAIGSVNIPLDRLPLRDLMSNAF